MYIYIHTVTVYINPLFWGIPIGDSLHPVPRPRPRSGFPRRSRIRAKALWRSEQPPRRWLGLSTLR